MLHYLKHFTFENSGADVDLEEGLVQESAELKKRVKSQYQVVITKKKLKIDLRPELVENTISSLESHRDLRKNIQLSINNSREHIFSTIISHSYATKMAYRNTYVYWVLVVVGLL